MTHQTTGQPVAAAAEHADGPVDPEALMPLPAPAGGRTFAGHQRVRWGDVDPGARLRLDGAARYLQDVGHDDTQDNGTDPTDPWIVRRTTIDVLVPAVADEGLDLTTFCGGIGPRWAERRTTVLGDRGAHLEAMALWVRVDRVSGRPARLDPAFLDLYADFTGDRKVSAALTHGEPPDDADRRPWALRATDFDPLGHVNNAATWEPVVDELARRQLHPRRAQVEYRAALDPGDEVVLASVADDHRLRLWLEVEGVVRASAVVHARTRT